MRSTAVLLCLAAVGAFVLVLGPGGIVHGDDQGAADPRVRALVEKVEALEKQVRYLRLREEATTTYLAAHRKWALDLRRGIDQAVQQGFTARAIPAESREALVAALRQLATHVETGIPEVTRAQQQALGR